MDWKDVCRVWTGLQGARGWRTPGNPAKAPASPPPTVTGGQQVPRTGGSCRSEKGVTRWGPRPRVGDQSTRPCGSPGGRDLGEEAP